MKVKELIEKLQELPEDATISLGNVYGGEGVAINHYGREEYILQNGFSALTGKTISKIDGMETGSESVTIETADGYEFTMHHRQDCCEYVRVEDVVGDPEELIGAEVRVAEEREGESEDAEYGTQTWTFYTLRTNKGSIDIRWLGESNGYYSESVDVDISITRKPTSKIIGCEMVVD